MTEVTQHAAPTTTTARVSTTRRRSTEAERLMIRIQRAIRHATGDRVRGLGVEVSEESVLLSGRCATYYCKQLAQHAAMSLAGERNLDNQIEVW